jgi:hypothetical protein
MGLELQPPALKASLSVGAYRANARSLTAATRVLTHHEAAQLA